MAYLAPADVGALALSVERETPHVVCREQEKPWSLQARRMSGLIQASGTMRPPRSHAELCHNSVASWDLVQHAWPVRRRQPSRKRAFHLRENGKGSRCFLCACGEVDVVLTRGTTRTVGSRALAQPEAFEDLPGVLPEHRRWQPGTHRFAVDAPRAARQAHLTKLVMSDPQL